MFASHFGFLWAGFVLVVNSLGDWISNLVLWIRVFFLVSYMHGRFVRFVQAYKQCYRDC